MEELRHSLLVLMSFVFGARLGGEVWVRGAEGVVGAAQKVLLPPPFRRNRRLNLKTWLFHLSWCLSRMIESDDDPIDWAENFFFSLSSKRSTFVTDFISESLTSNSVDIEHEDEHWMTILNKRVSNPNRSWAFYTFFFPIHLKNCTV